MKSHFDISSTYIIKNNCKEFNLHQCFRYLEKQGKKTYGQSFTIYEEDKPIILKLLIYAIRDWKNAQKLGLDLNKGILLSGPEGCGKTSLMHLIKPFFNAKYDYKIKTTREIAFEYSKNGYDSLNAYVHATATINRLTGYCFDNLGAEPQVKYFGNNCNVMLEILLSRCEKFTEVKGVSHITTTLTTSEIEEIYGSNLRFKMRENFNLISFLNNSRDKRF